MMRSASVGASFWASSPTTGLPPKPPGFDRIIAKNRSRALPSSGDPEPLSVAQAREAVANATLHAAPGSVELRLTTEGGRVQLEVRDDGRGMDVEEKERGGFGLFSMRERVALVNGTFSLESRPGNGTRVVATVALDDEDGR